MPQPERRSSLSPPVRRDTIDPGARDLEASDSDEHYSDARSGPMSPARASPVPRTRVERVDDKPAYGEVPGTAAYRMREEDAVPDEIAIIPDPSNPSPEQPEPSDRPTTPGGHPIPKTVVQETPDAEGSVTHPEIEQRHKSDPQPDLVVKADGKVEEGGAANDTPISPSLSAPPTPTRSRRESSPALEESPLSPDVSGPESAVSAPEEADDGGDEFGDDFDDFEEGAEAADFDDFGDDFQEAEKTPAPSSPPPPPAVPAAPTVSFPIPSFEDLGSPEILSVTEPYLNALFPPPDAIPALTPSSPTSSSHFAQSDPVFQTPRSASLWAQLVAPPPLQPPDWIRSRIRRLFLVSLGVPVDLDEILPASSKQKKLVLPLPPSAAARRASPSSAGRRSGQLQDHEQQQQQQQQQDKQGDGSSNANGKGSSLQSGAGAAGDRGRRAEEPERDFDLVSARQTCVLTDAALHGMTDEELREHVKRLEAMQEKAKAVLAYWERKTDEKIGDREAFEGVIENLVKHARKVRK